MTDEKIKEILSALSAKMIESPVKTERLTLRPFAPGDFANYVEYTSQPMLRHLSSIREYKSENEAKEAFLNIMSPDKPTTCFAVVLNETGKVIGEFSIGIYPFIKDDPALDEMRGVSLSFALNENYQRKGLMTELLGRAFEYFFEACRLDFINCGYFIFNEGSKKLQENAGMRYYTDHVFERDGEKIETREMIIFREEYFHKKSKSASEKIILKTVRLTLREYTSADFDGVYAIVSDPETMRHYPKTYDERGARRWIEWSIQNYKEHGFGWWAIEKSDTGEFIGDCGVTYQDIDGKTLPEVGYHINKNFWRQGYGKEAARAVIAHIFKTTSLPALYSYTTSDNVASYSLARSVGMKKIKEFYDEHYGNMLVYMITREEWDKSDQKKEYCKK